MLSVVIACYNGRRTIERCLASLRNQETSAPFETIVVDSSTDGTADLVRSWHPEVRLIRRSSRLFCGDARNLGLQEAQGEIIAFLDADCYVERHWVESVLRAHARPHLLIGGIVENSPDEGLVGWAYYFSEFSLWLPGQADGEIREVAGCALSFKRRAYDAYGPFPAGTYSSDTAFQWRARDEGHKPYLDTTIRVFHASLYSAGSYLRHIVHHRRCFARLKVWERQLGSAARLAHTMLTLVLPLLLLGVLSWRVARSAGLMRRFLTCLPLVCAGLFARAWGEFLGYVAPGLEPWQSERLRRCRGR